MVYRTEQKRILINQITLIKIIMHILERLMKGMTLEFAVTRIFELESKKDHPVNRLMIDNYLTSLKRGLAKNEQEYYKMRGLDPKKGKQLLKETQKAMMQDMSKVAYRQFEIKGYEKMLERMIEYPMQSAQENQNVELQNKLMHIKETLAAQESKNKAIEQEVVQSVKSTMMDSELKEALDRKKAKDQEFEAALALIDTVAKEQAALEKQIATESGAAAGKDEESKKDDDEDETSSYYDSEEDSEEEKSENDEEKI